jgi:hypothetical protein
VKWSRRTALAGVCAAVLPAAAACGIQPSGITALGPEPTVPAAAAQATPSVAGADSSEYVLFFEVDGNWTPVQRSSDGTVTESVVLQALVQGPTATEQKQGYVSALPPGLTIKPQALGEAADYGVSEAIGAAGRTELICTMQYFENTDSIGILAPGASEPTWLACSDTTTQYIAMPGVNTYSQSLLRSQEAQQQASAFAQQGNQ